MQQLQCTVYQKGDSMTDADYRKKVLGAWLGKAVGGTLGQPWEGSTGPLNLSYYNPVPTTMMPNDDLDLQILWACKLATDWNGVICRDHFAKAWPECIDFPFDEYGVAIRNLKRGIPAPVCGSYDNWFTDGLGAAIRSEIWACLAPGNPALAAKYAYEDACVDHAGNGIYAEQFLAALESQAFLESDLRKLIRTGLDCIPGDSTLARAIRDTVAWCENGTFESVRTQIMNHYGSPNFTDVKMNLPFMIMALLLGKGDFGKTICLAVNCGQDADCTGATVGAIFGIINPDLISEEWLKPIGHSLVVSKEISGIQPPATLEAFTELVAGLRNRVTLKDAPETEFDLKPFTIPARRSVFHPWFAGDFRKFNPTLSDNAETVLLPGNLTTIDFSALPGESLLMLETEFRVEADRVVRLLVNTPANMQVWVDGVFRFGRECGGMVPAFHRAMQNQLAEFELKAGLHKLLIGLAPATPEMKHADLLFGIADTKNHWLPNAFRR